MNNAIKEFSPLAIIAFSALLVAGIVVGNLSLTLLFILFLESSLLFYFMNSLSTSSVVEISSKMMSLTALLMTIIIMTIIAAMLLWGTLVNILLMVAVVLVAVQIIIVYRNH